MNRIEINVQTGERKVIELTPEEVADAQARTAAELASKQAEQARKAAMTLSEKLALLPVGITIEELKAALKGP